MSSANTSVAEETFSTEPSSNPQTSSGNNDDTTLNHRLNGESTGVASNSSNYGPYPKVWVWPWVSFFLFLYIFILFWINYAIVQRYWILHNWNDALPGLDKSSLRKFTMRSHMTAGAVALLLGPIQFLLRLPFSSGRGCSRFQILRHRLHRWLGRIYCTCGMLSCVFGLWFIALKKQLVGGYNMTASFALAGCAIGYTSFRTWQTARVARYSIITITINSSNNHHTNSIHSRKPSWWLVQQHRNWGIRSLAQILAPALYRYWYTMMELFHIYNVPVPLRMGGHCDANDLCPDYMRPWDSIYTWLYWISAGVVAEIIIYFLPSHVDSRSSAEMEPVAAQEQEESIRGGERVASLSAPLLAESTEERDESSDGHIRSSTITNYGSDTRPRSSTGQSPGGEDDNVNLTKDVPVVVNLIGCLLACAAIAITGVTLYTVVEQSSTES